MATNIPPVEPVPTNARSNGHALFSCPYKTCGLPPDFRNRVQDHIKTTHALDKLYPCPEPGCYKSYLSPVDILQHRIARHPRNHICPRYLCQALCSQAHLEYHAHDDKTQKRLKRDALKNAAEQWTEHQPVPEAATKPRSDEQLEVHPQEYKGGEAWIEYQHVEKPTRKPKVPKLKKPSARTEHQNPARGFAVDESESMRILDRDFFNHALGASPTPRPPNSHSRPQWNRSVVPSQRMDASVSDSMDALDRDFFSHALGASLAPYHNYSRPHVAPSRRKDSSVSDSMDALDRGFFAHVFADPPNYAQPATSYSAMSYASSSAQHQWSAYAPAPYQGASQPALPTTYGREAYSASQWEPTRSSHQDFGPYYAT